MRIVSLVLCRKLHRRIAGWPDRRWLPGLWALLLAGAAWAVESPRLAPLPMDPRLRPAVDLLTAELSKDDRVALLERAQIDKLLAEQSLSRLNAGDYVKVGQLLGAQGLLILELGKEGDRDLLTSRLVAVGPGVVLGLAQVPWPLEDLNGWTQIMARQFGPLFPKLGVLSRDAVPISILNVRAAVQSRQAAAVEQALTTLLAHRLMAQPEVFVLERRQMETLGWEKELQAADASPFWGGSYLLEGTIDPEGFTKETLTLVQAGESLTRRHRSGIPPPDSAGRSRASHSVGREPLVTSEGLPRLTRTALDVGGPCVEAFGW